MTTKSQLEAMARSSGNMRMDHIAYRVEKRDAAVYFLRRALSYSIAEEFEIEFDDGSVAKCNALTQQPAEAVNTSQWKLDQRHLPPEIFVSEGTEGSIVDEWVKERNGGGVHHIAYQVHDIEAVVEAWKQLGVEFVSESIIDCPDDNLRQIFTKPLEVLGGIIIELIERGDKGFCTKSVKNLMNSTKGL